MALEIGNDKELPFTVRRVYYIYHTAEGVSRGYHAHRDLKQVAICVAGSCRMVLDNGVVREEVIMDCPTKGILIESMIWKLHCRMVLDNGVVREEFDHGSD